MSMFYKRERITNGKSKNNETYVEFTSEIYGKLYAISNSALDLFEEA